MRTNHYFLTHSERIFRKLRRLCRGLRLAGHEKGSPKIVALLPPVSKKYIGEVPTHPKVNEGEGNGKPQGHFKKAVDSFVHNA
jgi:hypothetical protein